MGIYTRSIPFLCAVFSLSICGDHSLFENDLKRLHFVSSTLLNGQKTVRVAHAGVASMESMVGSIGEAGLFFRQVSDGKQLVKLVYRESNSLVTCDVLQNDQEELHRFFSEFLSKTKVHQKDMKQDLIEGHLRGQGDSMTWEDTDEEFMGKHPEYAAMTDIETLKNTCMDWYEARKQDESRGRQKRMVYPGTKYCGWGNVSSDYTDLGDMRSTDKCCREHDICPFWISSGKTKYGYYNYGISTMVHCRCDERFRTCLKNQRNPAADNLGNILFNIVKSKCFTLSQVRVCTKKSFWGRCTEYTHTYQAEALEPMEY